jgi:hypothetical protein
MSKPTSSTARGDKIDLTAIGPAGTLDFIGDDAFSAYGQVQAVKYDGYSIVRISTESDFPVWSVMEIEVTGDLTLQASDFLL